MEAFTAGGGRVTLSTVPLHGLGVVMRVRDDGPGLPPEHLGRVGEPFFSTKPNGTGLGLAICRALAWQYGATLDIRERAGRGHRGLADPRRGHPGVMSAPAAGALTAGEPRRGGHHDPSPRS